MNSHAQLSYHGNAKEYIASISSGPAVQPHAEHVLRRLKSILLDKAPEALSLLDELVVLLSPIPKEIVEEEKRARSVVIAGVAEAQISMPPFQRQLRTENSVHEILG
ncbi:hypothetical protein Y032_0001g474 [Ancylostoma ceylanicum]|uniref:Uncharacterized protein n=1 Tax=Ancylostoma ceylanicum TaxID=53326 RepID=A0A016W4T7_9BILA|nr:hypothetical protein Y032_0001g474 [Ancylostoma ceylanicum]